MSNGTFEEFRDALRAFESGWDRDRYEAGIIQDWQLDQWAGGPVTDFYPGYSSWGELSDAEWDAMSYMSTNSLGFVGYQFGEALLIDLGYYDDDIFYGSGASTNTWDGTWTGKNGVTSLADFMTKSAQETAIQEAFGYNLKIIEDGLAQSGECLDDYLGTTRSYLDNGAAVTVTLTMTGIMAAAHLRGAWGTLALLQAGDVSTDENGTSILRYVEQFGGYDAPTTSEAIAFFEDRKTGDEGVGVPGEADGATDTGDALNNPAITKENASVVITWASGQDAVVTDFDAATDTIFIDWIDATALEIAEVSGSVVFSVPSNSQSTTLQGIHLADLQARNIHVQDSTARAELAGLIGAEDTDGGGGGGSGGTTSGETGESGETDGGSTTGETGGSGDTDSGSSGSGSGESVTAAEDLNNPGITKDNADLVITWSYGQDVTVSGFNPAADTIFIDWIGASDLEVTESGGDTIFAVPSNGQRTVLEGVTPADLIAANIHAHDSTARAELASLLSDHDQGAATGSMITIAADAPAQTIDGFDPATGMIHIGADVTADGFAIFGESGTLGDTVRIELGSAGAVRQIVFSGLTLDQLSMANFSIADQGVQNEVAAAIGSEMAAPASGGGYILSYDLDGTNPATTTGITEAGGVSYLADTNADDIAGFDPITDRLDFGGTSVHGMIVAKSEAGEIVIDSPWSDAAQIVQGVTFQDVTIDTFGIVGNEHLRQDIGAVVSWEQGLGPRDADTVYIRSHEYGVHDVIDNFDPAVNRISFLYFGTRERLSAEDTAQGLVISSLPTGQSLTLTGVTKADLVPGRVEFHHDQVMEDNLETPFGFDQNEVTLVDRSTLLTPAAPDGATTDGYQTRDGLTDENSGSNDSGASTGTAITLGPGAETVVVTWDWGAVVTVDGFDFTEDTIDLTGLSATDLQVTEANGALIFDVLNNGGHRMTLTDLQAEDLTRANLTAETWNGITDDGSAFMQQLQVLGFADL